MTPRDSHACLDVGGRRLDSWVAPHLLLGVEVELATGEASSASVRVHDPDFAFINSITTTQGVEELPVTVMLGFGPLPSLGQPVFEGLLAGVDFETGVTTCKFFDHGYVMRKLQRTEYHQGLTDLGVIEKLARRNGLGFEGPSPPVSLDKHKSLKQEAVTDWTLTQQCAEEAGLQIYVRGRTLYAKEAAKTAESAVITLQYKEDFLLLDDFHASFRVPENKEGRPRRVEVRGRGRRGRTIKGESDEHARGTEVVTVKRDLRIKTKRHADRRAEAKKALQREHAFNCNVGVLPSYAGARADVRQTVALARLPRLFNGKYLVDRASHVFSPGGLRMELDLYRDIKN